MGSNGVRGMVPDDMSVIEIYSERAAGGRK
jgi:hypothetical protein